MSIKIWFDPRQFSFSKSMGRTDFCLKLARSVGKTFMSLLCRVEFLIVAANGDDSNRKKNVQSPWPWDSHTISSSGTFEALREPASAVDYLGHILVHLSSG